MALGITRPSAATRRLRRGSRPPEVEAQFRLALAFRGANPVVSVLGGGNDGSAFWHNTDAVIFERGGTGAWTSQTVAALSSQAPCNNVSSDFGFLVGLWPALATLT